MNSDTLIQLLQKGFRISLGATASLVEILQDPQRRAENLSKIQGELSELAELWAAKGEMTEQEARNFVDTLIAQRTAQQSNSGGASTTSTTTAPSTSPDVQLDLQELTEQIAAIRAELEKLREQEP